MLLALVLILAVAMPAQAGTGGLPRWKVTTTLALGTERVGVDCPDASTCWALESGRLLSSADGGTSWTDRTALVPDGIVALNEVDCVNPSTCYFVATDATGAPAVLALSNGAMTRHGVPSTTTLSSITCASALRCLVTTGTASYRTDDGGVTWQSTLLPRTLLGTPDLDCVAHTQTCYLIGNYGLVPTILKSTDGGASWTMQSAPYNDGGIYGIDCPTTALCYATGADYYDYALVIRTVDGGQHWGFARTPSHAYPLRSVSCPDDVVCTAVGESPARTPFVFATTDGQNWTQQSIPAIPTEHPAQVSCPTTTQCAAVASAAAFATTDGGSSWNTVDVPAGREAPNAMTCATALRCLAAGTDAAGRSYAIATSDSGATWRAASLPAGTGRPNDLDCPTRQVCYATAVAPVEGTNRSQTQFLKSTNGGQSWQLLATRPATLGALTCPDASTCLALGYNGSTGTRILRTVDGGATWTGVAPPAGFGSLSIACGAVTSCVFVLAAYNGPSTAFTSDDLGTTYHDHALPPADWFGLDCAGSFCMLAGARGGAGAIATSSDGGATWADQTVPRPAQLISDVSCGSPQSCAASTYDFAYRSGGPRIVGTRDGGTTWEVWAVPARNEAPIAVACHGARCLASDYTATGNPIIVAGPA